MGDGLKIESGNNTALPTSHHFYHDMHEDRSLSTTVLTAILEIEDGEVSTLEFCLQDHVDTDALDSIFAPKADGTPRGAGQIQFSVPGYSVTVHSEGHIIITESQTATPT